MKWDHNGDEVLTFLVGAVETVTARRRDGWISPTADRTELIIKLGEKGRKIQKWNTPRQVSNPPSVTNTLPFQNGYKMTRCDRSDHR
jgi:hypothetical protein